MSPLSLLLLITTSLDCSPQAAWSAGREGAAAAPGCGTAEYREAHRLGQAVHDLRQERDALERQAARATPDAAGALRRRQRQIDTDLEAIRGLATIKGWPLDLVQEPVR
jgi:hypothetical protein